MKTLSIIIVNWNTSTLLCNCLATLQPSHNTNWLQLIVVDNASTDDSVSMMRQLFPSVEIIINTNNQGYGIANNQGIKIAHAPHILFLNSDTIVKTNTLQKLAAFMNDNPTIGICSPQLRLQNGSAQTFAYGGDPTILYLLRRGINALVWRQSLHNWQIHQPIQVDWVSGASMLVKRAVLDDIGGFDPQIFMYFEDNDLCLQARKKGWQVVYNPTLAITHIGGQSMNKNPKAAAAYYESLRYFYRKHYSVLSQITLSFFLSIYNYITRLITPKL